MRHVTASIALLLVVGCGKPRSRERDAGEAASLVRIRVDGEEVARLDGAALGARPRLRDVLPEDDRDPAAWTHVGATARGRRTLSLWDPAKARPDQEIHVYLASGAPAIGLFRAPPPGASPALIDELAKPRVELTEVEAIDVQTLPPPPSPRAELVATVNGAPVALDLTKVPKMEQPRGTGGRAKGGWSLRSIAEALAPGATIASVRVRGDGELEVTADQLGIAELRINRRGELGLDLGRERGPRAIRSIDVVTAK